jgi:hypothetical protein
MEKKGFEDWIRIEDYVYDISSFKKWHPGGPAIVNFTYQDATDPFSAYHFHSDKAKSILATLPKRKASIQDPDDGKEPMIQEFRKLRKEFIAQGLFEPVIHAQLIRILVLVLIPWCLAFYFAIQNFWITSVLLRAFALAQTALIGHELGHRTVSGKRWIDVEYFSYIASAFGGISMDGWNIKHNRHHIFPQETVKIHSNSIKNRKGQRFRCFCFVFRPQSKAIQDSHRTSDQIPIVRDHPGNGNDFPRI